ncbi:MAG: hypothetical protein E2598_11015 [Sphingobium sp.]|nr:hypothetical protein [Sphingobium sp.]
MTAHLRLRIHISEPWDFERQTGMETLTGWTVEHEGEQQDEWEVMLDTPYEMNDVVHDRVLINPRYVGEKLGKVFDSIVGMAVRIAHQADGDYHYAMAGTLSLHRDEEQEEVN